MPKRPKKQGIPGRPDGRPEVYDVAKAPDSKAYKCALCEGMGPTEKKYDTGEIFMTQAMAFICKEHLPDNVVIFNPQSGTCRDKSGHNVWKE